MEKNKGHIAATSTSIQMQSLGDLVTDKFVDNLLRVRRTPYRAQIIISAMVAERLSFTWRKMMYSGKGT